MWHPSASPVDRAFFWCAFLVLVAAVFTDLKSREIPDVLPLLLIAIALVAHVKNGGWLDGFLGVTLGFGVGCILFALGGFGGGDVKLIAGLGAVFGWRAELGILFYIAIFGGVLAVLARLRHEREYAYAPAIALGLFAFLARGYWK